MSEDISRLTSGVNLPEDVSSEIWANTIESSTVMQLARQISLPGNGVTIPIITGDAEASWTDETDEKAIDRATLSNKSITPYKLAVIEPFSNEFKRDLPGLYAELARRLPQALGTKFDKTVFASSGAPGSNFDQLGGVTAQAIKPGSGVTKNTYAGLVAADKQVSTNGGLLNGWALSPQARSILLGQVDTTGRPLIVNNIQTDGAVPALLGQPTYASKAVYVDGGSGDNTVGFAGDWSQAVYGTVQGIQVSVSNQATIADGTTTVDATVTGGTEGETVSVAIPKQLNLWQRNMFAILVEVEIGFRVRSTDYFVKLTDGTIS